MRTRFRYDADLDAVVEIHNNYFEERPEGPSVISDDIGAGVNGLRAMHRADKRHFDSKSAFRADVRDAGLQEVGTEANFASMSTPLPKDRYGQEVKDAYDQYTNNFNGIADRVRNERLRRV